jgi:hypothetical protein
MAMAATLKRTARKSMTGMRDTASWTTMKVAPQAAVTATRAPSANPDEYFQRPDIQTPKKLN